MCYLSNFKFILAQVPAVLPAPYIQSALLAVRLSCSADVSSLQYEPMMRNGPFVLVNVGLKFLSDSLRRLAVRQPKPPGNTADMGIYRDDWAMLTASFTLSIT